MSDYRSRGKIVNRFKLAAEGDPQTVSTRFREELEFAHANATSGYVVEFEESGEKTLGCLRAHVPRTLLYLAHQLADQTVECEWFLEAANTGRVSRILAPVAAL